MKIRTDNWRVSPQEDNEKFMENKPEENDKKTLHAFENMKKKSKELLLA